MRRALLWSAIASFLIGMLLYAWGQTATGDPFLAYRTFAIEFADAINIISVVFWLVFALFYFIHIRRSEHDLTEEKCAAIAEAWLDGRRASLLRGRSRRR